MLTTLLKVNDVVGCRRNYKIRIRILDDNHHFIHYFSIYPTINVSKQTAIWELIIALFEFPAFDFGFLKDKIARSVEFRIYTYT